MVLGEEDNWLRRNIFHTKCTSHGKICSVIIDGGSFENVVSAIMVDKLCLKTEKHPNPYKLSWLKKDNEIRVSKRCLVAFSIGKNYSDEVWCDVGPMDACHLLLGRPWQYDRKKIHDGYKNTYSFVKDGFKVVLGPSKFQKSSQSSKVEGNTSLSQFDYRKELGVGGAGYVLVVVEENEDNIEPPLVMKHLLEEFHDVIP